MLFALMHVVHVLTVILWIGGLAFVTLMILPMALKMPNWLEKVLLFQRIEHRFAGVARIYNLVTGITGFIMVYMSGWHRVMLTKEGIPLTVMTVIWVFWFIMLWGLEPIVIKKMLANMQKGGDKMDVNAVFRKLNRMHYMMLAVSLVASASGIVFGHMYHVAS